MVSMHETGAGHWSANSDWKEHGSGHARAYVAFDVLYRHLRQLGYEVQYVRNFTDVDDKIIKRAAELGEEPSVLSQRYVC